MTINDRPILLIIPDVHGRMFWMSAVRQYPELPVVFLGDYLDPYTYYEAILPSEALENFREILNFKKDNMDKVTLLLGNHDIHYFGEYLNSSRKDKDNFTMINRLFSDNLSLFLMAMNIRLRERNYLLTHAGIVPGWMKVRTPDVDMNDTETVCNFFNHKVKDEEVFLDFICNGLMDRSASRWGNAKYPSPMWADVDDHILLTERLPNAYQIFGHTQQELNPVITNEFACLDCRKAFLLLESGKLIMA